MKKTLTAVLIGIILIFFLLPNLSLASGISKKGIKVGLDFAKLHGKHVEDLEDFLEEDVESRTGFCVGFYLTYSISEMFAIQPEILFTTKGATYQEEIYDVTLKASVNLSYIDIPVLAKLLIPTQSSIKPSIFAGPYVGINLSGKSRIEIDGEAEEEDIEDLKDYDLGLIIGGDIDFKPAFLGKGSITVDIRYALGLTTLSEEEDVDVKNGVILLMIGYNF